MSEYQTALVIGALITAIIAFRLPRAWRWIAAGAISFVLSTVYYRYDLSPLLWGLPYPAFTLVCDAAVCLSVYAWARERWEEKIYHIFQLSVLISLLYMSNVIADHWLYIVSLELLNWAALLTIGGTALLDRIKGNAGSPFGRRWADFHSSDIALRAARRSDPWHKR